MPQGFYISRNIWLTVIISIWLLSRAIMLMIKKKNNKLINFKRELLINIFAIYVFSYIGITLFPITIYWVKQQFVTKPYIELIPIKPIIDAVLSNVPLKLIIKNTFGNIILTIPFGVFLPLLWTQKFKKIKDVTIFGLLLSLLTEILQYAQGVLLPSIQTRASDTNDIILNVTGVLIGYLIFKVYYALQINSVKSKELKKVKSKEL